MRVCRKLRTLAACENGHAAIEYCVLAAGLAGVLLYGIDALAALLGEHTVSIVEALAR